MLFPDCVHVIDPIPDQPIKILVKMENGCTTTIKIVYSTYEKKYLSSLVKLGMSLHVNNKNGNCRNKGGDMGKMFIVGRGKKQNNDIDVYSPTLKGSTEIALEEMDVPCRNYLTTHFPDEYKAIKKNQQFPPFKALGEVGLSKITVSINLKNSAHFDYRDACNGIATWVEKVPGEAKGWFFILPNCTFDKKRGIVVRLRHGVTISWDGKVLHHCSTVYKLGGNNKQRNSVFGIFYGANFK